MKPTMRPTPGPKAPNFLERMEFGPVRVAARLRQEGSARARDLAQHIEADLRNIPLLAAAEAQAAVPRAPIGSVCGRTVRITPALLRYLKELDLRLQLSRHVSEALRECPEWSELLDLL